MITEQTLAAEFVRTVMSAASMNDKTPLDGMRADWACRHPDGKSGDRYATVGEIMFDSLDYSRPAVQHEDVFAYIVGRAKAGDDEAKTLIARMGQIWAYHRAGLEEVDDRPADDSWMRRQDEAQGVPEAWSEAAAIDGAMVRIHGASA